MGAAEKSGHAPLDLVFLGCGQAARMHSRTIRRLDRRVRLHYASRDEKKAASFCKAHDGHGAFGSYEAALAAPEIDVALVATPPSRHLDLALAALEAGKDVIVEKPAFPSSGDFARVREASDRTGRRVLIAENYFYKPLLGTLQDILSEGLIGEPLLIQVNALKWQTVDDWRADPTLAGGGALLEGGIHWIHLMANLGLEVNRVVGHRAGSREGSDESVLVVFEYEGGAVGSLSYSWSVPSPLRGLRASRIFGRSGSVTFESNGLFVFVTGRRTRFRLPGLVDISGYRAMFTDFFHALRTGKEPQMTLDIAERDIRLVEAAYRSIAVGDGGA